MARKTLMLIGGVDNGDYEWLVDHADAKSTWSCPKHTNVGDTTFIYITAPYSQVLATAPVIKSPRPGHEVGKVWRYVGKVGPIKLLRAPIPISELKSTFPDWAWLRYPRAYAYVPPDVARQLARRARLKIPPVQNAEVEVTGAGFGDAETNRRVERAAIDAVKRYYRSKGYSVRSRESENVGYDLDVKNGNTTLHVEVKGVSNEEVSFPITANEFRCAEQDPQFRLAVVTQALQTRHRKIHHFTGRRFLSQFTHRPLAFMAKRKLARTHEVWNGTIHVQTT